MLTLEKLISLILLTSLLAIGCNLPGGKLGLWESPPDSGSFSSEQQNDAISQSLSAREPTDVEKTNKTRSQASMNAIASTAQVPAFETNEEPEDTSNTEIQQVGYLEPAEPSGQVAPANQWNMSDVQAIQNQGESISLNLNDTAPRNVGSEFGMTTQDSLVVPGNSREPGTSLPDGTVEFADQPAFNLNDYTTADELPVSYQDMTIQECIRLGIQNSKVIRDLGGAILRNPDTTASVFDPAITYSDPIFGEEAALSEFDARLASRIFFESNDREVNNAFLGDNGLIEQRLGNLSLDLSKRIASGGIVSFRSVGDYDRNNSIGNQFGSPSSSWQVFLEGELRQPLLRGGRVLANRIAGPAASTGEFNGILLAKTRTGISVSDLKISVRNLVADIENAYWDLYFSYRDLEAKKLARDNALASWQRIEAKGGATEADQEGHAREQYFRFEADVQDAVYGRPGDGTQSNNGTASGVFRPASGVRVAERRLRYLIGLPPESDVRIRPIDEPIVAPLDYNVESCMQSAIVNRGELRIQCQRIRQAELQMIAARNMALPQLDAVGRYRFRGFGNGLFGDPNIDNDSALAELFGDATQEWQVGMELNVPIGYRREGATIRNIRHRLMREKQILVEQKRLIATNIANSIDNLNRAYQFHELQYNRLAGALDRLKTVTIRNDQKRAPLNLVLEAQRRALEAQTQLYRAKVEFAIARRNVEFETGGFLQEKNIQFADESNLVADYQCKFLRQTPVQDNSSVSQATFISQ